MRARTSWLTTGILILPLLAWPVHAEIVSIAGSVAVTVQEYQGGDVTDTVQQNARYPEAGVVLPLQVVARTLDEADPPLSAASVAAQFADPQTSTQLNPEEFAINLALLSLSDEIRYTAQATSQEHRDILFSPNEFINGVAGETVTLTGRLYVDGALVVFSPSAGRDLTGAEVTLEVTIVKQVAGRADETVFSGQVSVMGGEGGTVNHSATGDMPTSTLIHSNLAVYIPDFDIFEVLIIPNLAIDYSYDATLGEAFTLVATVAVQAANAEDEVGVAAVIGSPLDAVQEVIAAAQGESAANKTITALQQERSDPTGVLAFPAQSQPMFLPACGLFSIELAIGMVALIGVRCYPSYRRRLTA
ncbi:MAG: hypothetical protein ABIG44_03210 [Planctomycetota bacterium]